MMQTAQDARTPIDGRDDRPGHNAASPWAMTWPAWKQVLLRTWGEASDDNVGIVAAGVAFYGFLALVPLLGALVLSYGLVADPASVIDHVQGMMSVMPADAAKLIGDQLLNVVQTSDGKKGFGLILALALALFGARNAAGAIVTALNIAYEEKERRSFIIVNLLSIGITAAAVVLALVAMVAVAALGHLQQMLPTLPGFVLIIGKIASYAALLLAGAAVAATLYRYGPSRETPRWAWLTPGSLLAALLGLLLTIGFGIYVANFGSYNATYGSLGAVVVLLTWMYLSSYVLLFGAELNSELEHQTARDTTDGTPQPLGQRGAWVADHVAGDADSEVRAPGALGGEHSASTQPRTLRPAAACSGNVADGAIGTLAGSGIGRAIGGRPAGTISSALGTAGLMLARRHGRAPLGLAMIACAAALALLGRDTDEGETT